MILPDVSILVHAFRADSQNHDLCYRWLDSVVNGDTRYGLAPQVLSGFLRIVTHPKVFNVPSALGEALSYCQLLIGLPHCVAIQPADQHWRIFCDLCRQADARGNLIPDAWFAAIAIESGSQWITLDRDFARFPGLNWRLPD